MEINKSIAQGFGRGELYPILTGLNNLGGAMLPVQGKTYYVQPGGNNSTGFSWDNAFSTLTAAFTASNADRDLSGGSYGRNRIYVSSGADITEDLTTMPKRCDVIGVGCASGPLTIIGDVDIAAATPDTHWYNIRFWCDQASSPVFTAITGCNGLEFHGCWFQNGDGNNATAGLALGNCIDGKIIGCKIGIGNPPATDGIQITGTVCINLEIRDNIINAETTGIEIANGVTADYGMVIKGNIIAKMNPNNTTQMSYGIRYLDTNSRIHSLMVGNWISAVDAISHAGSPAGTMLQDASMANWINEAGTATMEDAVVDG